MNMYFLTYLTLIDRENPASPFENPTLTLASAMLPSIGRYSFAT